MQSEPSSGIKLTTYSCICWLFIEYNMMHGTINIKYTVGFIHFTKLVFQTAQNLLIFQSVWVITVRRINIIIFSMAEPQNVEVITHHHIGQSAVQFCSSPNQSAATLFMSHLNCDCKNYVYFLSSEISPTRCKNCVFILRNGFTLHVSSDNLTHHQEYICCVWPQVSRLTAS